MVQKSQKDEVQASGVGDTVQSVREPRKKRLMKVGGEKVSLVFEILAREPSSDF